MRSARRLLFACLTVAALAAPAAARAQTTDPIDRLVGRPITAIHLDVEGRRTDAPDLLELIEVQRNQPLDLATLRASVMQLHSAGRFDDIRVRGVESAAGVELIFELVPRHPVDRVEFAGVQGVPVGDLDRELRQRFNGVPRGAQADAVARAVERTLAERGYRQATVRPSLETTHVPDRATLKLTVEMGPLTVVTSAKVEGASPLSAADVLKRAGVVVGQPYRSRNIDLGLDTIIEELRARGYYEAAVSHAGDVVSADGRSAAVIITVDSAVPVTLQFKGDPLPGKDADLVPIKREGSADEDLLEDSVRRIESALRRDGYWKGRAAFTQTSTPAGRVITFTVTRSERYRFDRLEVSGSKLMTTAAIAAMIALEPDALFDESKVARGVAAIREAYRQQGYAAATITVTPEALPPARANGDPRVVERLVVDEGVQTRVAEVTVVGAMHLSPADVLGAMRLKKDGPYVPTLVPVDREAVRLKFDERGYNAAVVDVRPTLSDDRSRATIRVEILSEGPQTLLDHVIIAGNRRVSDETIRRAVALTTGQPLSTEARQALQQRLSALGFFRRVAITEAPHASGETGTDLIITVEESATTTVAYGGGLEAGLRARSKAEPDGTIGKVDKFEVAPRASFEVGRSNINGKNRSVNLFSGVSLRPKDDANDPSQDGKCCGFSEYRVNALLREPRVFGWNVDGLLSLSVEQAIRNSFNFLKSDGSVQMLRRLSPRTTVIGRYSLERVRLYNVSILPADQLLVDRLFPQIRLSVLSSTIIRDTRNDPVSPSTGALLSADTELAMRAIGSQVGFAKLFAQGFVYQRLDALPRVVLAGGARIGLVRGFAQIIDGQSVELVPASQRFFSGGSTSVRGFQQDRLGAPDILDNNGLSNGGNGMMVFNAEVRTALTKDLGIATFLDSGNVFSRVGTMHFSELRSALGAGLRYRSPIGPMRFDVGWKVGALRVTDSRRWEFHFSIGEAF
jgi:outer membrane protein insertion porin family